MSINRTSTIVAAAVALLMASSSSALATYPVIDQTAIAKAVDQINKLQEQITALTDIKARLQAQIDAMGKLGQIRIPLNGMARMGYQLQRNLDCLGSDLARMVPDQVGGALNLGNNPLCGGYQYRNTLWINPESLKQLTWTQRERKIDALNKLRQRILANEAAKSLGQADAAVKASGILNTSADELKAAADAAKNQNERLAVIAQGQALNARAQAQQIQLLAQMLRIQAAVAQKIGIDQSDLAEAEDLIELQDDDDPQGEGAQ